MGKVYIESFEIYNFRGQSFSYKLGERNEITGRNKSGKSSMKNAFFWLITGADEDDMTNHNLFDNRVEQHTKDTAVPCVVSSVINIDGERHELKRTAVMGWTRKRGKEVWERKGNDDYSFSIDEIDRTATEYKAWIEENIAPMDKLKCMINIMHFTENIPTWQQQRKLLSEIVGEIKDEDLTGDYTLLLEELKKYTIDELKERLKNLLRPLAKALGTENSKGEKEIELETLQKHLIDITEIQNAAEDELAKLKQKREDIQLKIKGKRKTIEPFMTKRRDVLKQIEAKELSLTGIKREFERKQNKETEELEVKIRQADTVNGIIIRQNKALQDEYRKKQQTVTVLRESVEQARERLEELRKRNVEIKEMVFDGYKCSYCGHELSQEQLEKEIEKFEAAKEDERKRNVEKGKRQNFIYETELSNLKNLEKSLEVQPELTPLVDVSALQMELNKKRSNMPIFEDSEEYKNYMLELDNLKNQIPEIPQVDTAELDKQLEDVNSLIDVANQKLGKKTEYSKQLANIQKVQSEIKEMTQERAHLERIVTQVARYEEERAHVVSERANRLFRYCHIKMYSLKKDGELTPNCIVTVDKVGRTINTGAKILAGIDISNAFCEYYGVSMPLFIDNYEALSVDNRDFYTGDRQLITMSVSDGDLQINVL